MRSFHLSGSVRGQLLGAFGLAFAHITAISASAGEQLWRFYADFSVTVVEAMDDVSGNGGKDVLAGSQDDFLYLIEGKGPTAGKELWSSKFLSTLSAAVPVPDMTGDGKPDVVGGDETGTIKALSGSSGEIHWAFLTNGIGTILSLIPIPDVDKDGVGEILAGSENDTIYCMSGKPGSKLGKVLWQFGAPIKRKGGLDGAGKKISATAGPKDGVSGVNSLALLKKGNDAFGVVAGVSNDTVYCFPIAGGAPKWKVDMPGDVWEVAAFPDQDGDGVEEVLLACGANLGFLLKGSTGETLWSHPVSMGAVSVAVTADMNGDGKPDALIGDGGGKLHCVPGNALGVNIPAAWIYDFGDTSTIHSIAALGDVDGDGRADCAVGTSHDLVAVITGKGTKAWSQNLGGSVFSVASVGDLDGNGVADVAAGSEMGFAAVYQGTSGIGSRLDRALRPVRDPAAPWMRRIRLGSQSGVTLGIRDLSGRRIRASAFAGEGR